MFRILVLSLPYYQANMGHNTTNQIKVLFLFLLLLIPSIYARGQQILTDTSYIKFNGDQHIPVNYLVTNIVDNRETTKNTVGYGSQKKFLLIPVDKEICLNSPLSLTIQNSLNLNSKGNQEIELEIKHFIIKKELRRFSGNYVLEADFIIILDTLPLGYLSYNYRSLPINKNATTEEIYEQIIEEWHPLFKMDIESSINYTENPDNFRPETLITSPYKRYNFFNINLATVFGLDFWQVDGEISFSRPETPNSNIFQGSIIRYQSTKDFEVIAFGKRSEHYQFRLNPKAVFHLNSNILIGINKWREIENIKLQQVFQIALSSYQTLSLTKENAPGINLKIGAFENLYYIIEKPVKFQAGLYTAIGYKF